MGLEVLQFEKELKKMVNLIIKKFKLPYTCKEDLTQEGYLIIHTSLKSFNQDNKKSKQFWIELNLYGRLARYAIKNCFVNKKYPYIVWLDKESNFKYSIEMVEALLKPLSELDKAVLYMYFVEELSVITISRRLGIIRSRAKNILTYLEKYFEQFRGGDVNYN